MVDSLSFKFQSLLMSTAPLLPCLTPPCSSAVGTLESAYLLSLKQRGLAVDPSQVDLSKEALVQCIGSRWGVQSVRWLQVGRTVSTFPYPCNCNYTYPNPNPNPCNCTYAYPNLNPAPIPTPTPTPPLTLPLPLPLPLTLPTPTPHPHPCPCP